MAGPKTSHSDESKSKLIQNRDLLHLIKFGDSFTLEEFEGLVDISSKVAGSQSTAYVLQLMHAQLNGGAMQQLGRNSFRFMPEHRWNADAVKENERREKKPFWPDPTRPWIFTG
jgi:hypothetical protein